MIKTLYDLQLAAGPLFAWPLAALAGATALASLRTGIFPQWYGLASAAGTVWFVVAGFSWAREGFFEVDGAAVWVAPSPREWTRPRPLCSVCRMRTRLVACAAVFGLPAPVKATQSVAMASSRC